MFVRLFSKFFFYIRFHGVFFAIFEFYHLKRLAILLPIY